MLGVPYLKLYGSWLAVEGSHPGTIPDAACSRTADDVGMLSWWVVDLKRRTLVSRIKVYPNNNCGMYC